MSPMAIHFTRIVWTAFDRVGVQIRNDSSVLEAYQNVIVRQDIINLAPICSKLKELAALERKVGGRLWGHCTSVGGHRTTRTVLSVRNPLNALERKGGESLKLGCVSMTLRGTNAARGEWLQARFTTAAQVLGKGRVATSNQRVVRLIRSAMHRIRFPPNSKSHLSLL